MKSRIIFGEAVSILLAMALTAILALSINCQASAATGWVRHGNDSGSDSARHRSSDDDARKDREARQANERQERDRQAQADKERQAQAERNRQAEHDRQAQTERDRSAREERDRQAQAERHRQAEHDRQAQAERDRGARAERDRRAQAERNRQAEHDRQAQAERDRNARAERERQAQAERNRQAEHNRQVQAEQDRIARGERERQAKAERVARVERDQQSERVRQATAERDRIATNNSDLHLARAEADRQKQLAAAEHERQVQAEREATRARQTQIAIDRAKLKDDRNSAITRPDGPRDGRKNNGGVSDRRDNGLGRGGWTGRPIIGSSDRSEIRNTSRVYVKTYEARRDWRSRYHHYDYNHRPSCRGGFYHYGVSDWDRYRYGFYCFSYRSQCTYPSLYFYYGTFPYLYRDRLFFMSFPRRHYVYVPIFIDDDDYYLGTGHYEPYRGYYFTSTSRREMRDTLADIREAWETGDSDLILRHVRSNERLDVFFKGTYSYSIDADDYTDMTRDAMETIDTISFNWEKTRFRAPDEVVAYGKHKYYDRDDQYSVVSVTYTLERRSGDWYITEVGSSPKQTSRF